MWSPPRTRDAVELLEAVIDQLRGLGARSWQIGLTAPALSRAILDAEAPKKKRKAQRVAESDDAPSEGETPSEGDSEGV